MKSLYIIKAGTTFPETAKQFGDFDLWTAAALGETGIAKCVVDAEHGAALPAAKDCAGVVVTGSHAMVTDNLPWSVNMEAWIVSLLAARVPFFGICYGHQLLARAAGGKVGYHPCGAEVGTTPVDLLPDCADDPLFRSLPVSFRAHVTHEQTVLVLPPGAKRLAANAHEPNHAFRLGDCAWGVQFHPEYTADIMRSYVIEEGDDIRKAGGDAAAILEAVLETPVAAETLRNFARFVEEQTL